ncbi:MAG: LPS-assembly protein LptD, partial [Ghiorsea sp.]
MIKSLVCCALLLLGGFSHAQAGELTADKMTYGADGLVKAEGNVHLQTRELTIQAQRLHIDLDAQSGDMDDATIQFQSGQTLKGAHLQRVDLERFNGDNILYSSCPEDDMAWQLTAKHATLDQESGTFVAQDAWFELAGVPVLYAPRWQHALSRRSGFLMPTVAQGSRRGLEITAPFYWAASPSWDMTLSPRWMDVQGLMGEVE